MYIRTHKPNPPRVGELYRCGRTNRMVKMLEVGTQSSLVEDIKVPGEQFRIWNNWLEEEEEPSEEDIRWGGPIG